MKRTDLNITNATRIIIKRDDSWRVDSRLYNIEVRWDYDGVFAKYSWNNERYPLPQPITERMASVDTKALAIACSRYGLMYKCRFETDLSNSAYVEIWRKDLRDNKEEQRKLALAYLTGIVDTNKVTNKATKEVKVTETVNTNEVKVAKVKEETPVTVPTIKEECKVTKVKKSSTKIAKEKVVLKDETYDFFDDLFEDIKENDTDVVDSTFQDFLIHLNVDDVLSSKKPSVDTVIVSKKSDVKVNTASGEATVKTVKVEEKSNDVVYDFFDDFDDSSNNDDNSSNPNEDNSNPTYDFFDDFEYDDSGSSSIVNEIANDIINKTNTDTTKTDTDNEEVIYDFFD